MPANSVKAQSPKRTPSFPFKLEGKDNQEMEKADHFEPGIKIDVPPLNSGWSTAMQALRRQNKTPFEQFEEMQKRLKEMSNEEFMKLYDENKAAIERIREQQGVNLSSYASKQISGAQGTFAQLARAPTDGSTKMLERVNLCLMIMEYCQRSAPHAAPDSLANFGLEPSPPQANLTNVKPCGPNMQKIIKCHRFTSKSVIESQNGRNPLLHSSAGPKPVRLRKFYPPSGHEIDMDSLFEGPAAEEEPRCGRLVPSSLILPDSRPQEPQNHRLGSLDLRNISGRSLAAIARSEQEPSYKGGSKQTRPTDLGVKGLIAALMSKDLRSRGMPSDGFQERMDRPLSAPAAAGGGGGGGGGSRRERKAQSAAKAPLEGSNRDQAIAIESSDEEGEGKEKSVSNIDEERDEEEMRPASGRVMQKELDSDKGYGNNNQASHAKRIVSTTSPEELQLMLDARDAAIDAIRERERAKRRRLEAESQGEIDIAIQNIKAKLEGQIEESMAEEQRSVLRIVQGFAKAGLEAPTMPPT